MNIENIINEEFDNLINELKKANYKYGCLMLYYNAPKTWWDSIQKVIPNTDVVRVENIIGREKYYDAHVTLLYGFHNNVKWTDVRDQIKDFPVRNINVGKVSYFEAPKHDVIKFELDYQFLKLINRECKKLRHTSTFPTYKAHMTIAYVKKGTGKKYCELLNNKFKKTLRPTEYVFSTHDGKKHKFDFGKLI